jgi:hypothetical protein
MNWGTSAFWTGVYKVANGSEHLEDGAGAHCITTAFDLASVDVKWTWKSCRSTRNWLRA